ncbi:MAG: hypothetical protein ACREQO_03785 [Candidatus Binatia bacterium]
MSDRLEEIARRKRALIERCGAERLELFLVGQRLRSPFNISGKVAGFSKALKTHPLIATGLSTFLVSGYAGKLLRSSAELLKLGRLALPIWSWWRKRRKTS